MVDPLAVLGRHPYFAALPADIQKAIGGRAVVRAYEKGALVCLEGEPPPGLCLVASGRVRVFKASESGKEQDLYHVEAGQSFNDAPAFDGDPTFANAQATEPSVILLIRREALLELLAQYPEIGLAVVRLLARRLREVSSLAGDLALRHLVARVARLLLRLSEDRPVVTLPTRQKLAAMVGTVREVATRALKRLERRGMIRLEPAGRVAILDRAALHRLTRSPWPPAPAPGSPQKVRSRSAAATSSRRKAVSPRTSSISPMRSSARPPQMASDELQT